MFLDNIISFLVPYYIRPAQTVALFYADNSRIILDYIHTFLKVTFDIFLVITIIVSLFYMGVMLYSFFTKKTARKKGIGDKELPFVTIQIPTYNELAAINCANRCLDFDYPKNRYEIIIGDDSNRKEISKQIDDFASMHKDIVNVTRRGTNSGWKPGNLNYMLKSTKGEFIVIFDSDFLPEKDFLSSIIVPFMHDPKLAVVQARWRISNFKQNLTTLLGGSISLVMHYFAMPVMDRKLHTSFLCGSAEAIRKQALVDVGGWKEGTLTEDIECSLRLIKKGYHLTYLEELECDCETPFTVKDFCKQQMRWAYGVISAFKEHFGSYFFNSRVTTKNKVGGAIMLSGYTFSFLLMCLFVIGMLSFFTDRPAPINWSLFLSETGRNIIITCGVMLVTLIALLKRSYIKYAAHLIVATFSVGLVVTAYVNLGILKAIFGRPMQWFMLSKIGNRQVAEK
jgi:cellulose synthase/poly-beta-1,6-N-acetylglucosamine synthase-like glycosyltransferase